MSNSNVEDQKDSESRNLKPVSSKDAEVDTSHVEVQQTTRSDKPEEPRNQIRRTLYSKMYILCRELCFLLLLVLTYAAFQNNTPKISKSPNAYPFFPSGSIVKDWYRGELSKAIELASESDLAFVMYYAPWDAESQTVRQEFDTAAQHMHKYIHFAAINCWHPGSECRQQYSKVYSWPVLMAYPAHGRGIQYRGPRKAEHMLKFLQSVANPLTRINHVGNIVNHEPWHDAVVIGYVDAKLGSSRYGVFYTAALRFLERDPFREVQFLVVTQEFFYPTLELHLWNETLIYPSENEWRPEAIVSWITEHLHQVSVWASLPGGKSQSLSNYLQPGPALILFTPRNPLYSNLDYYTVLHEVALDYYNCHNNMKIKIYKTHTWYQRKEHKLAHKQLESKCLTTKKIKKEKFPTIVTYDVHKLWLNNTCDFTNTGPKLSVCAGKALKKDACSNLVESSPVILNKETYRKKHSQNTNEYNPIFTENNDPRSPENLLKLAESEKCHFFRIAHELQPALFAPAIFSQESKLTGLACKTNMSLSILALDSIQHHHFAEGLGIDILNRDDKSAVVIINPAFETHHVLQDPFNVTSLQRFIHEFTSGVLDRTLGSTEIPRRHTHHYKHHDACQHNRTNDVCIHELTTSNFLPTILQPDTAVIVLYHSVKCAFCSGVSHALLTTARTLGSVNNLHFARIDGDNHALPWEFAMHHFPSILFFPTRRKSESRVFPENVPITVPNIISFILANVESNMKLKIMWTICRQTTFDEDLQKCITSLRIESMTLVGKLLRVYRFSTDVQYRTALLKQLQILRSLHFLLENSLDMNAVQKQISLLRPLDVTPKKLKREGAL